MNTSFTEWMSPVFFFIDFYLQMLENAGIVRDRPFGSLEKYLSLRCDKLQLVLPISAAEGFSPSCFQTELVKSEIEYLI